MMPKLDGVEVCRRIPRRQLIAVHSHHPGYGVVRPEGPLAALEAGGDEFLTKPVDHAALVARVKSMLRIKALQDTVQGQAAQLQEWNQKLEQRVADQVSQLDNMGRLKRFFSPQLDELILAGGTEDPLKSHRRGS
jgi:DNA-binding response OmpR family regulator